MNISTEEENGLSNVTNFPSLGKLDVEAPTSSTNADFFSLSAGNMVLSLFLFVIAGIAEIGGGYLVWIGVRNKLYPVATIISGYVNNRIIVIYYNIIIL